MRIAAFNVKQFGQHKVSDQEVLNILVKIISQYDIILILEVIDGTSICETLLNRLNSMQYFGEISPPLSRTPYYTEHFLFLYRHNVVNLEDTYLYEDFNDAFERPPFILRFTSFNTALKDLVLIPVHTKPDNAVRELDELSNVFLAVHRKWQTTNIMILGDFNADGDYVSAVNLRNISIRRDTNFHWLIGDDVNTTVTPGNKRAYDRIVVYGKDMLDAVNPGSARPFHFDTNFNLTNAMALRVSDHYPVEVELCGPTGIQPAYSSNIGQQSHGNSVTGGNQATMATQSMASIYHNQPQYFNAAGPYMAPQ